MRKDDITNEIYNKFPGDTIPKSKCAEALSAVLNTIRDALVEGDTVILRKFGTFSMKHKRERPGRNPKTGEASIVSERDVVEFKASKYLKDRVNGNL